MKLFSCFVMILATWLPASRGCGRIYSGESSTGKVTDCGLCGSNITVTIMATNDMTVSSGVPETVVVPVTAPQRELIFFMEGAAYTKKFNYTVQFYPPWGYMVTTINSLSANVADKTYWQILNADTGKALDKGVSSYVPDDGDSILFNFTTWASLDHN